MAITTKAGLDMLTREAERLGEPVAACEVYDASYARDVLRLTIPALPPKELRGNSHGYTRAVEFAMRNKAREWKAFAGYAIVDARNRCGRAGLWVRLPKAHGRVTYVFPDNRRRDVDNYSGQAIKPVLDALTDVGIIVDDSFQHLSVSYDARVERGQQRVELEVMAA